MRRIETKVQSRSVYRLTVVCISVACLLAFTAAVFAASEPSDESTYIDSVYEWGAWELDLEPASGPQASVNSALNNRARTVLFRPNDNAAYITPSIPITQATTVVPGPGIPATPPTPVVPAKPPIPVGPPVITGASPGAVPGSGDPRNR